MHAPATTIEEIVAPLTTLWQFDYGENVRVLNCLYERAKRNQWNAAEDLPWDVETDPDQVGLIIGPEGDPLQHYDFYRELSDAQRVGLDRRRAAWTLSQFLHGEQGAVLASGQLVEAVPDVDGKLFAATQVIDEARHVEAFHRYLDRLDRVYPVLPGFRALIEAVIRADLWQMKCVGMQVITESMLMGSFKATEQTTDDDVLRQMLHLVERDEARHIAFGIIYLRRELAEMSDHDRERLEDFAAASVEMLAGPSSRAAARRALVDIMADAGVDTDRVVHEMVERDADREFTASLPNPIRDHTMKNLRRLGLVSERTAPRYVAMGLMN